MWRPSSAAGLGHEPLSLQLIGRLIEVDRQSRDRSFRRNYGYADGVPKECAIFLNCRQIHEPKVHAAKSLLFSGPVSVLAIVANVQLGISRDWECRQTQVES